MKAIFFTQAYNAEKTLARTIESILGQTFQNFDYYILNNGSTDQTRKIIQEYAKRDQRVFPLDIKKNDLRHGDLIFSTLAYGSDADYLVWCDADDTYSPDFLEKMLPFAGENQLDVAACGYDKIDGATGAVLKRKASPKNMVLQDADFADRFIEYRGFTLFSWGKLYSAPFLAANIKQEAAREYALCNDSIAALSFFRISKRAGIYGEALYQYYQYPTSLSNLCLREDVKSYVEYWRSVKDYLEYYGPISKLNEDFLYAIYLSLTDEAVERIFSSDQTAKEKLNLLRLTFAEPLWAETLSREADPQFHNLAGRKEYVARMKERIWALSTTPEERELAERANRELDKLVVGIAK